MSKRPVYGLLGCGARNAADSLSLSFTCALGGLGLGLAFTYVGGVQAHFPLQHSGSTQMSENPDEGALR